ncbi:hypothetical protein [Sphaerisporangium dianthi]|uniref:Uncharacterized protein n=1 Tax=Sphaerisporangium dianthi TaxID=1436120 RepID=A0ABV9CCL1_9ACTN
MSARYEAPPPSHDEAPPPSRDEVPPPAYFVRSLPIMPTGAWLRALAASHGPFVAGLVLAFSAGAGVGLGLHPSCGQAGGGRAPASPLSP